ncbi:MAG: sigma-70 family RNA polymerase sigma factor [Lachnospiraceae bacterium]|nr:sigma-70 family RNA polymerase sigma factor [Lachnospiraceae bacterium]
MEENQLEELVDKAKQGDHAAFEELYSISSRQVYFTCISFLGNEENAKDVMQDVYITAYEKLSSLNDAEKFVPWVNRIAVNLCKKTLMKKSAVFMEIENAVDELTEENENFLPEEYITQKEKRKLVMDIMRNTLSDIQYKTVILYYFNGLPIEEIADIMECPPGTVKYRLSVARAKIKDGVDAYENRSGDKLYSVVGLPLLMRLLYEEANSIDIPDMLHDIMEAVKSHLAAGHIESADASSITNTTSINPSKGGIIKKMLKTPKTIIAATAATVVIIGSIATAVIVTNHENTLSSDTQTRQESQQDFSSTQTDQESQQDFSSTQTDQDDQQISSNSETDTDDQQISSNSDELVFWLHTVEWGEEKDLTGITLFNGECTTPISLDDFDGNECLGPYLCNENDVSSYNLTELFDPNQLLELRSINFIPQCSYDKENQTYIYYNEEYDSAISAIRLCNYTDPYDENITYRKAYENNWFYIISNDKFIDEFNIDHKRVFSDQSFGTFDALIDKYGRPSYLIAANPSYFDESEDSFLEMYNKNDGTISYTLVWEKEDFVLVLNLAESIERDKNMHTMDWNAYTSYFFAYVTPEIWPDFIPSAAYWQFYDLDDLR